MSDKKQLQAELKHVQELMEAIEEAWNEGRVNSDGDHVVPEVWGSRISMLLEC